MAALQSARVDIVNRVDPKVVDLVTRTPGVRIKAIAGRGYYVFAAHCNTVPFNSLDLRLALKFACAGTPIVGIAAPDVAHAR